jgi:hypothetical protein
MIYRAFNCEQLLGGGYERRIRKTNSLSRRHTQQSFQPRQSRTAHHCCRPKSEAECAGDSADLGNPSRPRSRRPFSRPIHVGCLLAGNP